MNALTLIWKTFKVYLTWLFLTVIFILAAAFTSGFRAYCPVESFLYGSAAVLLAILILGLLTGAFQK